MRRKKRGKKPSSNARARLSQSWWRHHFVLCTQNRLPFASVPYKKREPQTTKKKKWHRNPPRGDAFSPTLGDHHRIVLFVGRPLSPKSFPRFEIAVASTPHQSHLVHGARFFFSALDTTKENALIQHISSRGESLAPKRPVRERRKPAGRVRSRRFCFSRRKKTHHFSLLLGLLLLLLLLLLLCGGSCTRFVWRSKCVTFWGEKR